MSRGGEGVMSLVPGGWGGEGAGAVDLTWPGVVISAQHVTVMPSNTAAEGRKEVDQSLHYTAHPTRQVPLTTASRRLVVGRSAFESLIFLEWRRGG